MDDNYTGLPLANGKVTHTTTIGGRCVGFVGLVEDAWIQTLATVDEEQVTYKGGSDRRLVYSLAFICESGLDRLVLAFRFFL